MSKEYIVETLLNTFKYEKELFEECNVMIAGGVFTSLFTKKEVNDVDCYFRSKDDVVRFLNYINEYGSSRFCISVTDKSVTLIGGSVPIQLIYFKYFEDLDDVFNTFDFTISMCGYDFKTKELHSHKDFFSDLSQRRLSFNKETAFPLVSALRVNKFKDRGYNISRSEMIKLLLAVSKLEIKTPRQFIEQIGGFYGNSALASLSKLDEKDFNLEKGLQILSEQAEGSAPEINKVIATPSEARLGVYQLARLLQADNPLEGGWYRKEEQAHYLREGSNYKHTLPLDIALLFAAQNEVKEVKKDTPVSGMFYKWVKKTTNPQVFESHHRPSFKYEIGKVVSDKPTGLFFCSDEDVKNHYFKDKSDGVILMCHAETKNQKQNVNELRFYEVLPIAVVETPVIKSPELSLGDDSGFKIKASNNHCLNEELDLPDLGDKKTVKASDSDSFGL